MDLATTGDGRQGEIHIADPAAPRSRRVGIQRPPPNFHLPLDDPDAPSLHPSSSLPSSSLASSSALPSPPLPPRSPLRPATRRFTDASVDSVLSPQTPEGEEDDMTLMHSRSLGSLSGLIVDTHARVRKLSSTSRNSIPKPQHLGTGEKPLPILPPPSPSAASVVDAESNKPHSIAPSSASGSLLETPHPMPKRVHALLELLQSERAYASDLALVAGTHLPLALGQPASFNPPHTPPLSSSSSARTVSTASSSSGPSTSASLKSLTSLGPPMTPEDARIIFNNIEDLADFAGRFTEKLERALGNLVEGGEGEDRVGALFLEVIPEMEPLYHLYITKHSTSLSHLTSLTSPPSPAMQTYLTYTQTLSQSLTHAWDLPSLLIKPVQRLLKYSLLLHTIIECTDDSHGDKANLRTAKERVEAVARGVNEGRRRREVVREYLGLSDGSPQGKKGGKDKDKDGKGGSSLVGKKPFVGFKPKPIPSLGGLGSLARMKSVTSTRSVPFNASTHTLTSIPASASISSSSSSSFDTQTDTNDEAAYVRQLAQEMNEILEFILKFAKETVMWGESVLVLAESLRVWAERFGRVIGVEVRDVPDLNSFPPPSSSSEDPSNPNIENGGAGGAGHSDAFDAFTSVITHTIVPTSHHLTSLIQSSLLPTLSHLRSSTTAPQTLLQSLNLLLPYHLSLLHTNLSPKSRPSKEMLEYSQAYVALRAQLAEEMPVVIRCLRRGVGKCVREVMEWQLRWYEVVRGRWAELWDALRVEGEQRDFVGYPPDDLTPPLGGGVGGVDEFGRPVVSRMGLEGDGEGEGGAADETLRVWWARWAEVEHMVETLRIVKPLPSSSSLKSHDQQKEKDNHKETPRRGSRTENHKVKEKGRSRSMSNSNNYNLPYARGPGSLRSTPSSATFDDNASFSMASSTKAALAALDPYPPPSSQRSSHPSSSHVNSHPHSHTHTQHPHSPSHYANSHPYANPYAYGYASQKSPRSPRSFTSGGGGGGMERKPSNESLRSKKSGKFLNPSSASISTSPNTHTKKHRHTPSNASSQAQAQYASYGPGYGYGYGYGVDEDEDEDEEVGVGAYGRVRAQLGRPPAPRNKSHSQAQTPSHSNSNATSQHQDSDHARKPQPTTTPEKPPYHRAKSMPLGLGGGLGLRKASSQGRLLADDVRRDFTTPSASTSTSMSGANGRVVRDSGYGSTIATMRESRYEYGDGLDEADEVVRDSGIALGEDENEDMREREEARRAFEYGWDGEDGNGTGDDSGSLRSFAPSHKEREREKDREKDRDKEKEKDGRGRPGANRKPSLRRRLTDSLSLRGSGGSNNASPSSSSFSLVGGSSTKSKGHRRSPSLPGTGSISATASTSTTTTLASTHTATYRDRRHTSPSPRSNTPSASAQAYQLAQTALSPLSSQRLPPLYACRVIHPCTPPPGVAYHDLPFHELRVGDVWDVLWECGHPSLFEDLPLWVDDGEDCLLLVGKCGAERERERGVREGRERKVGWALASFLVPVD
ncbi:hypothetical protein K474DRAFT_1708227 [Panus rudis PR-1116 ss-1]|nr:hypothetical protein K474DRAFT_1708227 [Panus rudis PR-1116 ss-1]